MGPFTLQEESLSELSKTQTLKMSKDLDFAISMEILCTRYKVGRLYGGHRLRVNLFDARINPSDEENGSGFCVSNEMNDHLPKEFDSWIPDGSLLALPDIPAIESDELRGACFDQVPEGVRICGGITGRACQAAEVLGRAKTWCMHSGSSNCQRNVISGKSVNLKKWVQEFCESKRNCLAGVFQSDVRTCMNDIINDSEESFKKLEVCNYEFLTGSCAESVDEFPKAAPDSCTQGMSVQTSSDGLAWETEFFVPDTYMPCNGVLSITAEQNPRLFSRYVKFMRQDIDFNTCRVARPETSCESRPRFRVNFTYTADSCDLAQLDSPWIVGATS